MKYWVYMNGEVPGSYAPGELAALPGFANTTLVCPAEGEILEKNWRRSGEFEELIRAMTDRDAKLPPPERRTRESAAAAAVSGDVDALLDTTSARLFGHVSSLMKEFENRREERALTLALQRQLIELKQQLDQALEKGSKLDARLERIAELEESLRRGSRKIDELESALAAREEGMRELRVQLEKSRAEQESFKRRLGETLNDLAIRNRLVDRLSRDLTEKEMSLAKALSVIRRLEDELHRLAPADEAQAPALEAPAAPQSSKPPLPGPQPVEPAQPEAPPEPLASVEPARPAPASDQPQAQDALISKFRGLFGRLDH